VDLLALPIPHLPPSPLNWALTWTAVIAALTFAAGIARRRRWPPGADPALAAVALVGLAAMLFAVRFLWLGIFPIWFAAVRWRARAPSTGNRATVARLAVPVGSVAFAVAFAICGDWPMISRGIHSHTYAKPYPPLKYHAHAVWFLRDAGVDGRLWNDYSSGNFLGYWLAPRLRVFVNGSLNVPVEVMEAGRAIERGGFGSGIPTTEWLDRYGVDVFFGTGLPDVSFSVRGAIPTTTRLERTAGWIPVFRNLDSAVYLRANERNAANLERIAGYYAEVGVPFDPADGFAVERVIRESPAWATAHGIIPSTFAQIQEASRSLDPVRGAAGRDRLALLYAALGLYERAEAIDRRTLRQDPRDLGAARRRIWCLLHLGRGEDARDAAAVLRGQSSADDRVSQTLLEASRVVPTLSPSDAAALPATLTVFSVSESQWIYAGYWPPDPRIPE